MRRIQVEKFTKGRGNKLGDKLLLTTNSHYYVYILSPVKYLAKSSSAMYIYIIDFTSHTSIFYSQFGSAFLHISLGSKPEILDLKKAPASAHAYTL
jgi:hypothetical protein